MKQIPSPFDKLVVYGDFHGFSPEELFDHWVMPTLLTRWWHVNAEVVPRVGGVYRFYWPEQYWFLQGTFEVFDRGERLRFGWTWNHEPGIYEPLWVDLSFMPIENGTRLAIYHGPYENTEVEQGARQGNLEGWIHFGSKLAGLRVGDPEG